MDNDRIKKVRSKSSSMMTQEDIKLRGCSDIYCVLNFLAGVRVVNGEVQIFGMNNSMTLSTAALIVIDGIPMGSSNLESIPIESIETISVLKNASEYGVRGSNGAIVIKMIGGR
jgi:outer membrane receptor for ferrienterochelin and colicin